MSPESFTNALLITLISLIAYIGKVSITKIDELIIKVGALLLSDVANKIDIVQLKSDVKQLQDDNKCMDTRMDDVERKK